MSPRSHAATLVDDTDFRSYYGRPVIKPPVWKVPDVPAYLYLGGLAGASATMACCAELTGQRRLARTGHLVAAGGSLASVGALVHDLGRPARFLHMLRVFKVTSPLSVGSWILAPFSALASATAASQLTGWLPGLARISSGAAGVLGPAMTTYTAVLLADTAVPAWHEAYRELPFLFAGSAVSSAGAAAMLATPPATAAPARRMAVAGAALEMAATYRMHRRTGVAGEVYTRARPGRVLRWARALTYAGTASALVAGRGRFGRGVQVVAGAALTLAAAATRYAIFQAGRDCAADPKYTVLSQRTSGFAAST